MTPAIRSRAALLCLLSFTLSACAVPFAGTRAERASVDSLVARVDRLLADTLFVTTVAAVKVVSVETGQILYDRNSQLLMHPASSEKLFTSAAALTMLDPDFTFNTVLSTDGEVVDSVLVGNLHVKGYGDPLLDSADVAAIVNHFVLAGIRRIEGDLVADVAYFDDLYWGNGWMWDDEPDPTSMFISPLSVNHNTVTLYTAPGGAAGEPLQVWTEPETGYVTVSNEGVTVADSVTNDLEVSRDYWLERSNVIHVTGEMLITDTAEDNTVSVWRPELYLLTLLKEEMGRQGITLNGNLRSGQTPDGSEEVFEVNRPLDSVVVYMNKESDNLSAENLLKTLAAEFLGPPGSAEVGIEVLKVFLVSAGIDTSRISIADGSGVSRYDLTTAESVVQLLIAMASDGDLFSRFYVSLPVGGVDGTLESRMKARSAAASVHAKTGSLSGVSNLSGYVTTRDGELLAFSILMQNFLGPSGPYRDMQDRLVSLLADFSREWIAVR